MIVGHSERRTNHGETDEIVSKKAKAAHRAGLKAIICIGETLDERKAGKTLEVVTRQLKGSLPEGSTAANTVIAYEPVWAIGTGLTPTTAEVAEVMRMIRKELGGLMGEEAAATRILYGGSVKPFQRRGTHGPAQRQRRAGRRRQPQGSGFPRHHKGLCMMTEIPTLTKRRLQAQVIGPIFAEMVAQLGEEKASAILDAAIRKAAIAEGKVVSQRKAPGGKTSMADFIKLYELWTADGALEMKVLAGRRRRLRLRYHPLPLCRNLQGHGARQDRSPAVLQPGRHFLPGL